MHEKNEGPKLKSIDDFNKQEEDGNAPALMRLRNITKEISVKNELFDQVADGMKKESSTADDDSIVLEVGVKIKCVLKGIAAESLRIN